jgi:hypothetical protein
MIDILKKEINISDKVKFYLTSGKEVEVEIIEIGDSFVLVKNADGSQSRFFVSLIGGWDLLKKEEEKPVNIQENEVELYQPEKENQDKKIGLTIVGKIDLDKIEPKRKQQIASRIKSENSSNSEEAQTLSQHIQRQNLKFQSLSDLKELKTKMILANGERIIPANAIIKRFGQNQFGSKFGFVTDKEQRDYYFNISDISDSELKKILDREKIEGLHIVCDLKTIKGKSRATSIYLPKSIAEFQSEAESLYKLKRHQESLSVLNYIQNAISDFEPAINLKNKILAELNKRNFQYSTPLKSQFKTDSSTTYKKQSWIRLIESKKQGAETALKELAYELQREGQIDESIKLVIEHQSLIKTSDPNSLLAYFYETKKDFSNAVLYLNKIKTRTETEKLRLSKRLANAYFQLKDYPRSETYLKEVLAKQPDDSVVTRLLEALQQIKSEGLSDEIEAIFNEAELSSLTGGRSPYIQFAIANCEYAGIPAKVVSEQNFTKTTLRELRKLIDEAGRARPKERAPFLLTEAKLMEMLEPEKENELGSVLSRYCLAISQNLSSENNHIDIVRFYLLEAFKLANNFDTITGFVPIYFYSFKATSFEAYQKLSKSLDTTLKEILEKESGSGVWNGLIDLFLTNTEIFSKLLTLLFKVDFQRLCLDFLNKYLNNSNSKIKSKEDFQQLWNQAVEKRRREKESFNSIFTSLGRSTTTESFADTFNSIKQEIPNWLGLLDNQRINSFGDINQTIREFNTQIAFEDKERFFNILNSQINLLQAETESSPTEFSFNILRPLLTDLNKLIEGEFEKVISSSKPIISITTLGESIINDDRIVTTSFNISNKKGSAPISWFALEIIDTNDIKFTQENNESNQTLKGGDDRTLKLKMEVSQQIKEQDAFSISVNLRYKIRGSEEELTLQDNISIRLYSESEFEEIQNPFSATADSGPVQDEKMFYGRTEYIENIKNAVLESSSKCVIIYGQKRSGKSSVLFHLKKQLNQSKNAFCISFSLGEIVDDLSALTFYYKILSEIEDSLDGITNTEKPVFTSPTLSELKEAPSIVFNDYMKKFQKACSGTNGWQNKNLVLLLDEFTYIYTAIQKGFLSEQFMKTWKSLIEKSYFSSVLIGQDIMPKFKNAYQNEFGIAEDKRLSYLSKNDAKKLIEEPVWDNTRNRSRYLGKALDLILDYTSSNPYYVQIFCARLVEYMNSQKAISVTEADVYDVAQTFTKGEQSLSLDKFDNLITAGDADLEVISPEDTLQMLREIAVASKNLDSCSRDTIKLGNKEKENQILADLQSREVISCPQPNFYKINVRLFKEWLLNN